MKTIREMRWKEEELRIIMKVIKIQRKIIKNQQ
jgi:hypothetical protein